MANKPFDREVINVRERPLSTDANLSAAYGDASLRFMFQQLLAERANDASPVAVPVTGFVGNAFHVSPVNPAAMQVSVAEGVAFVEVPLSPADLNIGSPSISGLDDLSSYRPIVLNSAHTFNVPAADLANPRIDIVEVKVDRRLTDATVRAVLDPATGVFNPTSVPKTMTYAVDDDTGINTTGGNSTAGLSYKTGTPGAVPAVPATSAGYIKIAEIHVAAGAVALAGTVMRDTRVLLSPGGVVTMGVKAKRVAGVWSVDVQAPPGWKVALETTTNTGAFTLWIACGDGNWKAVVTPGFDQLGQLWTAFRNWAVIVDVASTQLGAAASNQLATDPNVFPNIEVYGGATNGQNVLAFVAVAEDWDLTTQTNNVITGNLYVNFQVRLSRA